MKDELERIIIDTANNSHMMNEEELKKRFLKLKTILSKRALEKLADVLAKKMDIGVTAQEVKENMDEALMNHGMLVSDTNSWIDLSIDNLPEFLNNKVDVQKRIDGNWVTRVNGLKSSIAYDIAEPTISSKYRYRIQENKEPIRITRDLLNQLIETHLKNGLTLPENESDYTYSGRAVIIID